ncbi:MAG TPA: hypothetical protein VEB70_04815 [Noviherbaspirillum sp.]|nr:hypothetical protein [Noviherbaspirillum sp.]
MPYITSRYFVIKIVGGEISHTSAGFAAAEKDGIGLSRAGRLCNFNSGKLMQFPSEEAASQFLAQWKHAKKYVCKVLETAETKWVREVKAD